MPSPIDKVRLLASLATEAVGQGISVHREGDSVLRGEKEAIKAKWFLGGKKSVYSFSCRLDEAHHTATFREMIVDRSWGIAPPGFKVESYSQSGTTVTSKTVEKAVGGGGTQELGLWRDACSTTVGAAGWIFKHEPTAVP